MYALCDNEAGKLGARSLFDLMMDGYVGMEGHDFSMASPHL